MITAYDFEQLTRKVIDKYQEYLDNFRKNPNISGDVIQNFNALYLQMNEAAEHLENGLKGLFSWEVKDL